jgi:hypothetical protein
VAVLCALALHTYYLSDVLYSEIPFALITTLFLICNRKSERISCAVLTAVLAVAAYALRTAGAALVAAWVAEGLVRRRFRQAAVRAGVGLVPVLLWQAHVFRVTSSAEYRQPAYPYQRAPYSYSNVSYVENCLLVSPFYPERGRATIADLLGRGLTNLLTVPKALGETMSAPLSYWKFPMGLVNSWVGSDLLPMEWVVIPLVVFGSVILGCAVLGGILLAFQQDWSVPLYVAASFVLLGLIPWPEQLMRYLAPLLPCLALVLISALGFLDTACRTQCLGRWKQAGRWFYVLMLTTIFSLQGLALAWSYTKGRNPVTYHNARGMERVSRIFFNDPRWQDLDAALEWVRQRASPVDVLATTVPHEAYLRTGLNAVLAPMEIDSAKARRLLDGVPVKYVLLDLLAYPGLSERYAAPAVEEHPNLWKPVYVAPGGRARVYERQQ